MISLEGTMNTSEANKIIAEYMGYKDDGTEFDAIIHENAAYAKSLDALVPVWEKLPTLPEFFSNSKNHYEVMFDIGDTATMYAKGEAATIQEAACIATARAILELRGVE